MSLKAGIVGLPNVGKSTLFNAITSSQVEAANYPFATINPNTGVVAVPDERLDFLTNLFKPLKKISATIEFYDIAGLVKGASKGEGLGNQFLSHIRECDAIVEVVRCFKNSEIIHVEDSVDAKRDIEIINLELAMADLETVNKRCEKVENKARVSKDKDALFEMSILGPLRSMLEKGESARKVVLSKEQEEFALREYHLLTMKPLIYVANIADTDVANPENSEEYLKVKKIAEEEHTLVIPVSCEIECEISRLEENDKQEFLDTLGIKVSGLNQLIRATYKLLNLSTFFTVGKDECRAWTYHNGSSAPQCAGIIHTDFEKGFIKAEVYSYEDIKKYGSELAVKEAGKLRIEGKDYITEDGDIYFFRFNV